MTNKKLLRDLRACYTGKGIVASTGHFNDVWTRDAMFASWGCLSIGDTDMVFKTLKYLLQHARDGLIPLKVGKGFQLLKFIGIRGGPARVWYTNDKNSSPPADSNSLFLITLAEYVKETGDKRLLKQWSAIDKVYRRLVAMDVDGDNLIEQGRYADWADSLKRSGKTLYSNACYAAASDAIAKLAKIARKPSSPYQRQAQRTKEALKVFWNGTCYDEQPGNRVFDSAANLLMVHWGLTTHSKAILNIVQDSEDQLPITTSCHANNQKWWLLRLVGMADYHENQRWSWISGLYLTVLREHDPKEHIRLSRLWRDKIEEDEGVYEVYEPDGRPVRRLFYRSQKPFAWGSGMMLYGLEE